MTYYVKTKEYTGECINVPVSREIFELYQEKDREDMRCRNNNRRHMDTREMTELLLSKEATNLSMGAEEIFFEKENLKDIFLIVKTCTEIQQSRFFLHVVYGLKYREIALMHGCSISKVFKSINKVTNKIKNIYIRGKKHRLSDL